LEREKKYNILKKMANTRLVFAIFFWRFPQKVIESIVYCSLNTARIIFKYGMVLFEYILTFKEMHHA